ncbi:MAG: indole-3-glycerol phosphate synthase TrpC [Oscillospiraceae bacterium]|nr:indole-3-glycerol phosphate synthase TrpC [Oscillospiraceae bacterium]
MGTILDTLAQCAADRTNENKKVRSLESLRRDAEQMPKGSFAFRRAIEKRNKECDDVAFICECKKASPSKGLIAPDFPYLQIAKDYEVAGADCISVLTEPKYFLGSDQYLQEIASTVQIPCLRKDFTVDPYMIYEAKLLGASAILLICAILDEGQLQEYHAIADSLGLSVLVEAHDEKEILSAVNIGAGIIGVNNRNLKDFSVNPQHALDLISCCPKETLFVVESGIRTPEDIQAARDAKANAILIGETLMRAEDKAEKMRWLKGEAL